mmetsp:Transcript_8367/g.14659  ORF Transcript_8367/g.14659 Transcript_8367/m.14659 type:complete len:229 (-) Transcript_8367:485-1171(-)|eukprot:CAMPEP_0202024418 /NCGR_PEP_ID=MMETSP0905-20130828/54097_1 /ASSEMBLY_ACC=CAM_ASM_000554 /TAXON_ID=420261 /ORGANISM="Thalassiosira antarctica, Strain CCMP982" /LENGTH=228 /DNA_ID=CAMNT_0048587053 /DNA_START=597 /DNA_END=1283 /DNA_ORIENTATION=-
MNGGNIVVNHTTFTGPYDIRTMSIETFEQDVLTETSQSTPFDLNDPAFGQASASIDSSKLNATIKECILVVAWPTITNTLFNVTCPNTVNKPSTALESTTQDYSDNLGNVITLSAQVYFQRVCHAIHTMGQNFSYCTVSHFVGKKSPQIRKEIEAGWTNHQGQVPHDAISQMGLLLEAQVKATKAKAKIGNLQGMISDHTNKSLMANGYLTTTNTNPLVLASQAKANI